MLKMRAPEGKTISLNGRPVEIERDGSYMAHPYDVDTLRSHGFEDWAEKPAELAGDIDTMTKGQLVEACVERTRAEAGKMSIDDLRSALRGPNDDLRTPTDEEIEEAGTRVNPDAMTTDRIAVMKRPELFAYLKAMKVSAPPPISNDQLRLIAADTLRKHAA